MYQKIFKRIFDVLISGILLIVSLPLLVVVIVALTITNNGKALFIQKRPGKNERIFKIYKFKTMNDKKDKDGKLLPDSKRITSLGHFIRKFSLDELPQLWNVLIGDMSLIGPRPLLISYLPLYSEHQRKRHDVKPGITGWAQVNGRNAISWEQKFEYDLWYVDNVSLFLDIKIVLLTIKKILISEGINSDQQITMMPFQGNKHE